MFRSATVAGVEFGLPLIEQGERGCGIADFVAEIVGDAAVGVDVEKMLAQAAGEKPGGYGEIFVVGAGQVGAVFAGFDERGCRGGDRVGGGEAGGGRPHPGGGGGGGVGGGARRHSSSVVRTRPVESIVGSP